jgi:ribose transport system substrate-binding protein
MKKPVIGLVMKSLQAEFFQEMEKGACSFAQSQTAFELITVGTKSQTEIELQIQLIEELIAKGVDALVVVPIDSKALVPVVVKAVHAGIKVINIDIRLDEVLLAAAGVELTYVGPDNYTAALRVGEVLVGQLKPGSKILLIEGLSVAENAQQRKAGFLKAIEEGGMVLAGSAPADWETFKAAIAFMKLFHAHPDAEAVMCCNDAMALGVLQVLEEKGLMGKIPVVGFDNDAAMQPYLASGALLATIDAFGSQMAVEGIRFALKVLGGMENKGSYSTPFVLKRG